MLKITDIRTRTSLGGEKKRYPHNQGIDIIGISKDNKRIGFDIKIVPSDWRYRMAGFRLEEKLDHVVFVLYALKDTDSIYVFRDSFLEGEGSWSLKRKRGRTIKYHDDKHKLHREAQRRYQARKNLEKSRSNSD